MERRKANEKRNADFLSSLMIGKLVNRKRPRPESTPDVIKGGGMQLISNHVLFQRQRRSKISSLSEMKDKWGVHRHAEIETLHSLLGGCRGDTNDTTCYLPATTTPLLITGLGGTGKTGILTDILEWYKKDDERSNNGSGLLCAMLDCVRYSDANDGKSLLLDSRCVYQDILNSIVRAMESNSVEAAANINKKCTVDIQQSYDRGSSNRGSKTTRSQTYRHDNSTMLPSTSVWESGLKDTITDNGTEISDQQFDFQEEQHNVDVINEDDIESARKQSRPNSSTATSTNPATGFERGGVMSSAATHMAGGWGAKGSNAMHAVFASKLHHLLQRYRQQQHQPTAHNGCCIYLVLDHAHHLIRGNSPILPHLILLTTEYNLPLRLIIVSSSILTPYAQPIASNNNNNPTGGGSNTIINHSNNDNNHLFHPWWTESVHPITIQFDSYEGVHVFRTILRTEWVKQQIVINHDDHQRRKYVPSILTRNKIDDKSRTSCVVKAPSTQKERDKVFNILIDLIVPTLCIATRDVREMIRLSRILYPSFLQLLQQIKMNALQEQQQNQCKAKEKMPMNSYSSDEDNIVDDAKIKSSASEEDNAFIISVDCKANNLKLAKPAQDEFWWKSDLASQSMPLLRRAMKQCLFNLNCNSIHLENNKNEQLQQKLSTIKSSGINKTHDRATTNFREYDSVPLVSKFLLLSGFICQTNRKETDARLFTNKKSGKKRRTKGSNAAANARSNPGYTGNKNENDEFASSLISAPPSFALERLLAIYLSIFTKYGVPDNSNNNTSSLASVDEEYDMNRSDAGNNGGWSSLLPSINKEDSISRQKLRNRCYYNDASRVIRFIYNSSTTDDITHCNKSNQNHNEMNNNQHKHWLTKDKIDYFQQAQQGSSAILQAIVQLRQLGLLHISTTTAPSAIGVKLRRVGANTTRQQKQQQESDRYNTWFELNKPLYQCTLSMEQAISIAKTLQFPLMEFLRN